jgi:hypothetical protein
MKFDVKFFAAMFAWHHRRNLQDSLQSRYYADLEFFLSCTALFDVPISVLLFGCRPTPIIRIIAGNQGEWPLRGSVYGRCGAFNEAGTIKPVFFGVLVKLLLKATTSLMSVRLHGTVPLAEGFL